MQKIASLDCELIAPNYTQVYWDQHNKEAGKKTVQFLANFVQSDVPPVWPPHNQARTILNILAPVQQVCSVVYANARLR